MQRFLAVILIPAALSACSAANALGVTPAPNPAARQSATRARQNYQVCGSAEHKQISKAGGSQRLPHITGQREFYGTFSYAAFTATGKTGSLIFSCPTSDPIAPTPQGFAADWFGSWTLICSHGCNSLSFANASLQGSIISKSWSMSETYYLYLYDLYSRQYIASYQVGPVTPGRNGYSTLAFASPFENGFLYPQNDAVALEIVHPSP